VDHGDVLCVEGTIKSIPSRSLINIAEIRQPIIASYQYPLNNFPLPYLSLT
jgi:hypothetical protein